MTSPRSRSEGRGRLTGQSAERDTVRMSQAASTGCDPDRRGRAAGPDARARREISSDYAGRDLLLLGVLKGAVFFMADLMRRLTVPCEIDFMAISSYGAATDSSGVVRILKDLDLNIEDRDVLVVEDIIDSGLTLSYLMRNLEARNPASLEICALLTKPAAARSRSTSATSASRSRTAS